MKIGLVGVMGIFITSILLAQEGQSGLYEYRCFSRGGNSCYVGVDTSGMEEDKVYEAEERALYNVPSYHEQSGLMEYETHSRGGNSSFIGVETEGMNEEEKSIVAYEAKGIALNDQVQKINYRERASRMQITEPDVYVTGQAGYRDYYYARKNSSYYGLDD